MTAATLTTPLAGITDAKLMYEALARKLHNVALDVELRIKAELAAPDQPFEEGAQCGNTGPQLYGSSSLPFDP